jgi:hypothetical protein
VFILKGVKVVCFDTVLQVLILKELEQGKRRTKESEEKAAGFRRLRPALLHFAHGNWRYGAETHFYPGSTVHEG